MDGMPETKKREAAGLIAAAASRSPVWACLFLEGSWIRVAHRNKGGPPRCHAGWAGASASFVTAFGSSLGASASPSASGSSLSGLARTWSR